MLNSDRRQRASRTTRRVGLAAVLAVVTVWATVCVPSLPVAEAVDYDWQIQNNSKLPIWGWVQHTGVQSGPFGEGKYDTKSGLSWTEDHPLGPGKAAATHMTERTGVSLDQHWYYNVLCYDKQTFYVKFDANTRQILVDFNAKDGLYAVYQEPGASILDHSKVTTVVFRASPLPCEEAMEKPFDDLHKFR